MLGTESILYLSEVRYGKEKGCSNGLIECWPFCKKTCIFWIKRSIYIFFVMSKLGILKEKKSELLNYVDCPSGPECEKRNENCCLFFVQRVKALLSNVDYSYLIRKEMIKFMKNVKEVLPRERILKLR